MKQASIFKKKFYIIFTLYFIGFGIIVALITSYVNYKSSFTDIDNKLKEMATSEAEFKRELLFNYISRVEMLLSSITKNELTRAYIKSGESDDKKNLSDLFYAMAYANKDIMQLRYLNASGMEIIRIDRDKKTPDLIRVPDNKLQDKSQRYYFKESSLLMANQYWHSNIDLNMEHGQIEKPIKPTFRVATQLVVENNFEGVLIVNLLFENTIKLLSNSVNFDIYLSDKEGEVIYHPNDSGSWSKYLDDLKSLHDYFPNYIKSIITHNTYMAEGLYSYSYGDLFRNNENLKILFVAKAELKEKMQNKNIFSAMLIAFTVLLVSIPLSWVVSIIPSQLQSKLAGAYEKIRKNAEIIDKFVMTSSTNKHGIITDISTCFTKITGYTSDEVIGKTHSILRHPDTRPEYYKQLWDTVLSGKIWERDIKNVNKAGKDFWIHNIISPEFDSSGEIEGYTAVVQDITDKKKIEQLSITDNLTGLYNRQKLSEVLATEIARYDRYKNDFSIILFDIDFFKRVNDTYGHLAGDDVLIRLAEILKENARETDFVCRWGGEEFLIIAGGSDIDASFIFAEKLRKIIEKESFSTVGQVTISCGIGQYTAGQTEDDLVSVADKALYKAKESGRNKVVMG
ncbi:MAG: diguanylate cyclase [Candidatus Marinimicrobia bacterium]|nr:diguanylate cyclase [Candidatus Neomarinimicrobiota bacterium]